MSKKYNAIKSKKLIAGIALALGCSLMSVASAASYDMTSDMYADGMTLSARVGTMNDPDVFSFGYDKATGKVIGGNVSITADAMKWPVYGNFSVKASDLPDCSAETINKVAKAVLDKYIITDSAKKSTYYYYLTGYAKIIIVDDNGNVIRRAKIAVDKNNDYAKTFMINGGTYTQVLKNDPAADQYELHDQEVTIDNGANGTIDVPANTLIWGGEKDLAFTIAPDLSKEALKAAVQGTSKDLTVTNRAGKNTYSTILKIVADGTAQDTVYGIYNNAAGSVDMQAKQFDITATGNADSNAIYAGNNADYTSKITYGSTATYRDNAGTLSATGNVVEAGKNGVVEIKGASNKFTSDGGNIFYAHDGGSITVGNETLGYMGLKVDAVADGKYLALAENGSSINLGTTTTHLDDANYDKVNILQTIGNANGNMKTDADSKITFGISGTGITYNGSVDGNFDLYFANGAIWNGAAAGDNINLDLGNEALWKITENGKQHIKSLTGADSSAKRSFVNVGAGDITIDKYSGNTTFVYDHDTADGTKIIGGNINITSAAPKKILSVGVGDGTMFSQVASTVYLQTSADGIDTTDEKTVNAVLDNLAKKLIYSAYVNGERNLSGRVEIAEGLTSASVARNYKNLTFNEKSGQAETEGKLYNPYTSMIMGSEVQDAAGYGDVISGTVAGGDLQYKFGDNTLIEVKMTKDPRAFGWGALYCAAISNWNDKAYSSSAAAAKGGSSYSIDMQGHDLNVVFNANAQAGATGSQPNWTATAIGAFREGTISIDNPGRIYLESRNNYYYGSTIRASTAGATDTGAHVVINNKADEDHVVTIRGGIPTPGYELNWRAIEVTTQNATTAENGNSVDIKGLVDIEVDKCASLFARGNYARIDIGGGRIVSNNYSSIWTSGTEALININMQKDADGNILGAGNNYVQIEGDVSTATPYYGENGTINLGLTTSDSYVKGHIFGSGNNNLYLQNGASWDNKLLKNHNWSTGTISDFHADSVVTNLYGGDSLANAGNIYQNESKNITIGNLSGFVNAYIGHAEDDATNFSDYGDIIIEKATQTDGKNANITLLTDRSGIDTSSDEKINDVLSALAKKLIYKEVVPSQGEDGEEIAGSSNLDGQVGISEGLTAGEMVIRLADLDFSKEDGAGSLVAGTLHIPDPIQRANTLYGSSETAMMKGAKSAMAGTAMIWRAESNDLMKRMGDLRMAEGDRGLWAKYYGGKYEMDAQNTKFSTSYKAYQLGYDTKAGDWTLGAAVSYNDGNSTYGNGRGDEKAVSLGLYGTWNKEDGQYLDLILKRSRLENEFKIYNDGGHKLDGDYKNWATSLSAEYGKRFEGSNGFYVDPSIEFTVGRVDSKNYNAQSDYLDSLGVNKKLEVQQDAFTTAVGRLGVRFGQKLDKASYFVKLAAAHEFSGDFDTTYHAINEPEGKTSVDFGDTWYEAQIGGTAKLSDNSLLYASFERSFGGDVEEKWRVDAGLRWSF